VTEDSASPNEAGKRRRVARRHLSLEFLINEAVKKTYKSVRE
jgi:hypothetical protein